MTGWRVGWMIGPKDVMKASTNFQSHATSNVANVSQVAALAAVSGDLTAVHMMRGAFARRGALMHKMLSTIPGVTCMAFGAPGFARFSFALGDDDLVDGIQRIIDYVA